MAFVRSFESGRNYAARGYEAIGNMWWRGRDFPSLADKDGWTEESPTGVGEDLSRVANFGLVRV